MKSVVSVIKVTDAILGGLPSLLLQVEREDRTYYGYRFETELHDLRVSKVVDSKVIESGDRYSNDLAVYDCMLRYCVKYKMLTTPSSNADYARNTLQYYGLLSGFTKEESPAPVKNGCIIQGTYRILLELKKEEKDAHQIYYVLADSQKEAVQYAKDLASQDDIGKIMKMRVSNCLIRDIRKEK